MKADLVIKNANIYIVDKGHNWVQAIAIADDKIVFTGTDFEAEALIDSGTKVIDLDGRMVLPGFIDAHAHPSQAMDLVGNISLYGQDSIEAYKKVIKGFVGQHPEREFFRGSGWADTFFPNLGPTKEILDVFIPDKPAAIISYDGHSMWVNSATLNQAGITKDTPDPEGGRIEREPDSGDPSGTLRETAFNLIEEVIPDHSLEERKNGLLAYQEMAIRAGITTVHDAMIDPGSIEAFNSLAGEGKLKLCFRGSITLDPDKDLESQIGMVLSERSRNTHPNFQTNTVKIFVDGVLEGGTAYLFEPYKHKPDFRGVPIWDPVLLNHAAAALDKENLQIHLHVIGDAALSITLDALELAREKNGKRDTRHMVTHLQLARSEDIQRFKELDLVGLPQPFWFKIDEYYSELALPYLGKERADKQYPMRSFIEAGVVMASSSDFPVTIPFDPVIAIQTGITRTRLDDATGKALWVEERVRLEDMIKSYTHNGAYANFLENETGSIEVGKKADIIVLDQNLFDIPTNEIAKTKVLMTFIAGKEVYKA
ncbi:amidohydrolase [Chloroflexota bacterium]